MPIGGYSYDPSAPQAQQGGMSRPQLSPQEAVRLLNLRLPKTPQNAPIPSALMNAPGGASAGGAGSLQALLQALMRVMGGGGSGGGGGEGTRQEVGPGPAQGIDNGIGGVRSFNFTPRINIADGGERSRYGDAPTPQGPMDDTPLFDAGTPRVRTGGGVTGVQPLF